MPFALFDTTLGPCAIAWSERGITGLQLPEANEAATRARVAARRGVGEEAVPPAWVREATCAIARHLEGTPRDLASIRLDMTGVPPFHARVYEAARTIEPGRTLGYADLARLAGSPKATRAVGQAMARNPFALLVPCHRVLAAGGAPGGFSAFGGEETKRKILGLEGVRLGARSQSLFERADAPHGLAFDPVEAARALADADAKLAKLVERVGPLRLRVAEMQTPFQALAESIVYQQLTGKAAATILARVHALHGGARRFGPEALLAMPGDKLRAAGLSAAKTAALKDLAAKTLDGTVPTMRALASLDEESIVERLTTIRGIGRWTVEMLLIFRLGRPDVLPVQDYGVRKGFMRAFRTKELPTPKELAKRGERWRPYRTAASWYLWRACELE
jgi:methylated-DNA-[protein]-cysteine S-methyltransferase